MSPAATPPRPCLRLRRAIALSLTAACGAAEPPRATAGVEAASARTEAAPAPVAVAPAPVAEPPPETPRRAALRFEEVDVAGTACARIYSSVYSMGFGPDERTFFTLHNSGAQCVYQVVDGRLVNQRRLAPARPIEHDGWPNYPFDVPLSPDRRWGLTFSVDNDPLVWRLGTRRPPWGLVPFPDDTVYEALLTDDSLILQNHKGAVGVWSLATRRRREFTAMHEERSLMAVRDDGGALALAGSAIAAWDLATGAELLPRTPLSRPIWAVAFVRDTPRLIAVDQDGGYHEWDLSTPDPPEHAVHRDLGKALAKVWFLDGGAALVGVGGGKVAIYRALGPERAIEVRPLAEVRASDEWLKAHVSRAGGRFVLDAGDTTWIVRTADARIEAKLSGDTCRQGPWALGESSTLVSHGGGGLCVWLP